MWDGKGYPDGLSGEAIPIGARILAVADCFDALTSDRPYRRALTKDQAIAVIVARRGTQYDPWVVDTFVTTCDTHTDACHDLAGDDLTSSREAEIREVIAPRLTGETEAPAPVTHKANHPVAGLDDRAGMRRVDVQDSSLPTFQAISRYVETVAPGAVCVLYIHAADEARLVASQLSSPSDEFLLRGVSMPLGDRLTGWVGATREAILNSDPGLDLGRMAEARNPQLRSCFATPLVLNDNLFGVLSIYSPDQQGLSRRQTQTVTLLATEGLEQLSDSTIEPVASVPERGPRPLPARNPRAVTVSA